METILYMTNIGYQFRVVYCVGRLEHYVGYAKMYLEWLELYTRKEVNFKTRDHHSDLQLIVVLITDVYNIPFGICSTVVRGVLWSNWLTSLYSS